METENRSERLESQDVNRTFSSFEEMKDKRVVLDVTTKKLTLLKDVNNFYSECILRLKNVSSKTVVFRVTKESGNNGIVVSPTINYIPAHGSIDIIFRYLDHVSSSTLF